MFTIGESRSISQRIERERQAQDNVTFNKWLGILAGEDLPSKLYCSEIRDLRSSASNEEDQLVYRAAVLHCELFCFVQL